MVKWRLSQVPEECSRHGQFSRQRCVVSSARRSTDRSVFITRTYTHLVGGILGFILVELGLFESGLAADIARFMFGLNWMLILGAFMLTGWLATRTAQTSTSLGMQYFAYAIYVVAEALIFVPLLYIADRQGAGHHRQRDAGHRARRRRPDVRRAPHAQGLLASCARS